MPTSMNGTLNSSSFSTISFFALPLSTQRNTKSMPRSSMFCRPPECVDDDLPQIEFAGPGRMCGKGQRSSVAEGLGLGRPARQAPQHFLYFLPLPQGHGSFRPTFCLVTGAAASPAASRDIR